MLPVNRGKGAAVLHGLQEARRQGYTHALTMDADGQHPASHIGEFMAASQRAPKAMVLGVPQFDASAPALRRRGRRISNWWANLETLGAGVQDSLFGFRVYPIAPLVEVMQSRRWMRRFDFDPEAAVRLVWAGVPPLNLPAPVRYLTAGRRRRLAFQLPARQRAADLDAYAPDGRIRAAPAAAAAAASPTPESETRMRPRRPPMTWCMPRTGR